MKVEFSKAFIKSALKLSGKVKSSLNNAVIEVEAASSIEEITDCKKLTGFQNSYRIRIGGYRAFFTLHVKIDGDLVFFQYLVRRGEAYNKQIMENLRDKEAE